TPILSRNYQTGLCIPKRYPFSLGGCLDTFGLAQPAWARFRRRPAVLAVRRRSLWTPVILSSTGLGALDFLSSPLRQSSWPSPRTMNSTVAVSPDAASRPTRALNWL